MQTKHESTIGPIKEKNERSCVKLGSRIEQIFGKETKKPKRLCLVFFSVERTSPSFDIK